MQRLWLSLLGLGILSIASPSTIGAEEKPAPAPVVVTAKQIEAVWTDFGLLDDDGARKAQQGMGVMIAAPDLAVPYIRERVKKVAAPDARRIGLLIGDLDSNDFRTRDLAGRELEKLGPLAAPALEKKLTEKLGLETQRRVEAILERAYNNSLTIDELRAIRAIEVLQGIATPEASAVLQELAKGADGAVVTVRAREALANRM